MKLIFSTPNPKNLKSAIISLIKNGDKKTWEIYMENKIEYLKHVQQWGDKGVIDLTDNDSRKQLIVEVLKFKDVKEDLKDFEGYYLGRFCEIIFVNFPDNFSKIEKE